MKLISISLTVSLALFSTVSVAQYARTVSRANCASPTIPLLSPTTGLTFNESISWDPKFWAGHYVHVTSTHYWSKWVHWGYWQDTIEGTYVAGNLYQKTWRAWAGRISKFRDVTVAGSHSGYRSVNGTHIEKLPNSTWVNTFYTSAVNCNLTQW